MRLALHKIHSVKLLNAICVCVTFWRQRPYSERVFITSFASELLENFKEIDILYYLHSDAFNMSKFSTTQQCCTVRESG